MVLTCELDKDGVPNLVTSVVCPGGQGDVSIVGDLYHVSRADQRQLDCGQKTLVQNQAWKV